MPAVAIALVWTVLSGPALAMAPLEDEEMAGITGQDGIAVDISPGTGHFTADRTQWRMDQGTAYEASTIIHDLGIDFVGGAQQTLDVAGEGGTGSDGYLVLRGSWSDLQARIGGVSHSNDEGLSIGTFGIESTGSLDIGNRGGLFGPTTSTAMFDLSTTGDLFYRQSSAADAPELSFANLELGVRFTDGAGNPGRGQLAVEEDGLVGRAEHMDFDLNFDLMFSPSTSEEFDKAARLPMILTGWEGGIENATIALRPGGFGYGSYPDTNIDPSGTLQFHNYEGQYAPRTEGLTIFTEWDYSENFTWILGQAAAPRSRADFFDWQRLGEGTGNEAAHDFRLPLLLDAVNAGQGLGGICFGGSTPVSGSLDAASCATVGGSYQNVPAKDGALAVGIREGGLHAYNSQVMVRDVDGNGNPVESRFDWSLLYTFGKLDANIYVYPDGSGGEGGFRSDVVLAAHSPGYWRAAQANFDPANDEGTGDPNDPGIDVNAADRWPTNTHFLIADTDIHGVATGQNPDQGDLDSRVGFGIGILNADLLWRVDDFLISVVGENDTSFSAPQVPGFRLETDNLAKYQFRGLFGGGNLDNLGDPARIALIDVNLETDEFVFVLGPPREAGEQYVAFDALLNFTGGADGLDSGAYLTIAEPSNPEAFLGLVNTEGRIAWHDGRVELLGEGQSGTGRPELTIANDLLIGSSAHGGAALRTDVNLGDQRLGSIAIPSSHIQSSISLTPQN